MRSFLVIYRKELIDTLRDRRTLATMLLVPMVAYPLTLLLTTETIAVKMRQEELHEAHAVVAGTVPEGASAALESAEGIRLERATITDTEAVARTILAEDGVDVVVASSTAARSAIDRDGTAEITLYFDPTKSYSDAAVRRVQGALDGWATSLVGERMRAHDLPESAATPVAIERRSIATEKAVGSQMASMALPALILVFIAISSFYPAVDLVAGEKERRTLATLLCAPIRAIDIVLGKYFAVVTVGTLAGLLNVVVLSLTLLRVVGEHADAGSAIGFSLPGLRIMAMLPLVPLISLPIGALMLFVASLARSFRDASYLLTPVLLVAIAPASLCSLPGFELTPLFAAMPLANAALFMKALLQDKATIESALIVTVSSLAFTLLMLFFCARVFSDERVLFSRSGRRAELSLLFFRPPPASVSTGLVFASAIFIANYYGGFFTEGWPPLEAIAFTQATAHLCPAILLALWMRRSIDPRDLLRTHVPTARATFAGIAIGLGAWLGVSLPAGWLTSYLIPGQSEAARQFAEALGLDEIALTSSILCFAVLPALAEEIAFRGVLLGLFEHASVSKKVGPRSAVIAQAALFGLMHGSVFRFLPTALLGLLLGTLAQKSRSIWPSALAHAMTNGILIGIEQAGPDWLAPIVERPTPFALVGVVWVALGFWVLMRNPASRARGL
jgi:sodium transport system permease protein